MTASVGAEEGVGVGTASQTKTGANAVIHIRNKVRHTLSSDLIGFNVEDLVFQTYGGVYSQLLHGQDFEEHAEIEDLLPVTPFWKRFLYLRRQPDGEVKLVTWAVERGDRSREYGGIKVDVTNCCVPLDQFAPEAQAQFRERITGDRQINRYWRAVPSDEARGKLHADDQCGVQWLAGSDI